MHSSKLLTLISGLDASEFRWLHKFLKSPFYNTNQKVLRLFEYIKKYYPDLASPKLVKETAYQTLFPKQQFEVQKMRKLMHELTTLVEDFMVAQHVQKQQFERKKILTKELGQRNLYGLFEKNTEEITKELDKLPYRDKDYFLERYKNQYQFLSHPMTPKQQNVRDSILPLSENLDHFYFLQKLQLNGVLESAKHIYQVEAGLPFFETIQQEIKDSNLNEIPVIHLYILVNQLFQQQDSEELFNELYTAFFDNKNKLGAIDKEFILKYLINFVVGKTNKGLGEYVEKGLALYKIGLTENLIVKTNRITENAFVNIAWYSAFLKDFEFSANFIEDYQQYIDKERRKEVVLLAQSNLYFNLGQYEQVIDLLSTKSFSGIIDKLRAKVLLLKSYFELYLEDESYYNLVLSQIENFERNIRREENISEIKKINYLNFSKFFKRLIDIKTKKFSPTKFKNSLLEIAAISNRPWLNNKAISKNISISR